MFTFVYSDAFGIIAEVFMKMYLYCMKVSTVYNKTCIKLEFKI